MEQLPIQRLDRYRVTVIETFGHDLERSEQGLDLWRRFVRSALGVPFCHIHRDAQVRREVLVRSVNSQSGAEHQDRPLRDDLR